jgi:hypothetical protein
MYKTSLENEKKTNHKMLARLNLKHGFELMMDSVKYFVQRLKPSDFLNYVLIKTEKLNILTAM